MQMKDLIHELLCRIGENPERQGLQRTPQRVEEMWLYLTRGYRETLDEIVRDAIFEEAVDEIRAQISGSHMVFLAAGMGGGTGTGACSVIARVARELGILTVGVVTKPFMFEGTRRLRRLGG